MMNNMDRPAIGGELIRHFSNILTKLLVLNFLTLISCIPIITIGASLSAMHDCLLKVTRKKDDQISRQFFRSFRTNLRQATLLWLPFLMIFSAALVNIVVLLAAPDVLADWVVIPAASAAIITLLLFQFVMPLQAHFENTVLDTLRSAAILSVAYLPKTLFMAISWTVPIIFFWKVTLSWPLVLMFGFSLPGYFCAKLYDPIFLVLEENLNEAG